MNAVNKHVQAWLSSNFESLGNQVSEKDSEPENLVKRYLAAQPSQTPETFSQGYFEIPVFKVISGLYRYTINLVEIPRKISGIPFEKHHWAQNNYILMTFL